jgi:hypothetical protein
VRTVGALLAAVVGSLLVALVGALTGAVIAIALTVWLVPPDPFALVVLGFALLLLWMPIGALVAVWLAAVVADERSAKSL